MLWFSTFAASGLISVYVLAVAWFNATTVDADPLERAAQAASDDLIHETVFDPAFGKIGIRDLQDRESKLDIRSFNTVAALLRQSRAIAASYNLTAMASQSANDLKQLNVLKAELRRKLEARVSVHGGTYQRLKKLLARNVRAGDHLKSLQITLGVLADNSVQNLFESGIDAMPQDEMGAVRNGKLKAMTPLMVPDLPGQTIVFHQNATEAALLSPAFIKPAIASDIPTVVLIKAEYERPQGKKEARNNQRAIAIICGRAKERSRKANKRNNEIREAALKKEGSCLVLNFPQGKPDLFSSLADVLKSKAFSGRGEWQQAAQGTIPGNGKLAPPAAPVLADMTAREALGVAFYHWLRQLSEPVSHAALTALIESPWQKMSSVPREKPPADNDEPELIVQQTPVNSCLAADNDARAFAFLHQNAAQEVGQKALAACFAGTPPAYPSSAIPVIVDSRGVAITPGRNDFDRELVTDLLAQIYGTNLAAQDTMATARLVELSAHRAFRDIRDRINLHQADIGSLKDRMRLETDAGRDKILTSEIAALETSLAYEQLEQKRLAVVLAFAHTARTNAVSVANQSFSLSSRLFQVCRSGIHRLDSMPGAFLLGKRFIFRPQLEALSESQLFDYSRRAALNSAAASDVSWLQNKLLVFGKIKELTTLPETKLMAEGHAASEMLAEDAPVLPAVPEVIVYDSRTLYPQIQAASTPLTLLEYPFKGIALNKGQLVFYAQKAIATDKDFVGWSSLTRDFVANRSDGSGLPVEATTLGWSPFGTCPKIAAEWQMRSPVALLDAQMKDALKGATLTDPKTDQRMPVVPPADASLF